MSKKKYLICGLIMSFFFLGLFYSKGYTFKSHFQHIKNPFAYIWEIINNHEDRISDLEEQSVATQAIKVYDANDQFLGIYVGKAPGWGIASEAIFILQLKKFIILEDSPDKQNYGNFVQEMYFIDEANNIWLYSKDRIIRLCDGRFVTGTGEKSLTTLVGYYNSNCQFEESQEPIERWRYEAIEVDPSTIPFELPVEMPLHYE